MPLPGWAPPSPQTSPALSWTRRCSPKRSPSRPMRSCCTARASCWYHWRTGTRRQIAPVLHKARQDRADPPSALCACQAVQARQPNAADAAHPTGPGDPRYRAQDRRQCRTARDLRPAALPRQPGAITEAASARFEDLQPARTGSGVYRQGQGASAIRIWRQGLGGDHAEPVQRRAVRRPSQGTAGQPL